MLLFLRNLSPGLSIIFIDTYIFLLLHAASLEQPGLEVAELEAKLLHIEQLQIELEVHIIL